MLRYRICDQRDCSVWVELNRAFMREEINDHEFWHEADKLTTNEFRDLFMEGLQASDHVKFILFEEDEEPIGFANPQGAVFPNGVELGNHSISVSLKK